MGARLHAVVPVDELDITGLALLGLGKERVLDGLVVEHRGILGGHKGARHTRTRIPQLARERGERVERAVCLAGVHVAQAERADDVGLAVAMAVLVRELFEHLGCNARDLLDAFGRVLGPFGDVRIPLGPALDAVDREIAGECRMFAGVIRDAIVAGSRSIRIGIPYLAQAVRVTVELPVVLAHEHRCGGLFHNVIGVMPAVLHDLVNHADCECRIAAGVHGHELVGKGCRAVVDEPDVDDLRTVLARSGNVV